MNLALPSIRKVFVRAPNWVGDVVMATGAFARIRAALPDAEIHCGLRPYLLPLLAGTSWFDRYQELPKVGLRGFFAQASRLRRERYELAIVLPNSLSTACMVRLAGIRWRLGYRQGRPGLLNLGLRAEPGRRWWSRHGPRRVPKPMPEYYAELLDVAGFPPLDPHPRLPVSVSERDAIGRWLTQRGVAADARIVLLHAGASFGASKLWEPDRFARVAATLRTQGCTPIVLAGPGEVEMAEQIAAAGGALAATKPILPLDALRALTERAALMITTDSGPRHIAVALGVPVVCLIGPNDPRYTNYGLEQTELIRKDLPCSPCQQKICPLGHRECMTRITVDEVVAAAERLLART